jgi:hypothetical protein
LSSGAFGGEVVDAWDVVVSRNNGPGTFPAVVVAGSGLGNLVWVKAAETTGKTTARHIARASGEGAPAEKTLADKKEAYDKRRRQCEFRVFRGRSRMGLR